MTREEAVETLKENLCGMCAYDSQCMESCDIRSCDNRDAIKALEQEQKRGEMTKTLDAVKVVRCRECEYWKCNPNTKDYGVCGKVSYDDFEVVMEGDDFCSFGLRKREEMTKTLFMNLYNCEKFENLSNGVVYMKIPRCSIYDEIGREWIVNCVRQDNFECCFTHAFEQVERIKGAEQ